MHAKARLDGLAFDYQFFHSDVFALGYFLFIGSVAYIDQGRCWVSRRLPGQSAGNASIEGEARRQARGTWYHGKAKTARKGDDGK